MKFIQIRAGVTIRMDCIEVIERTDDYSCQVTVNGTMYKSIIPYTALVALLEREEVKPDVQYFAG